MYDLLIWLNLEESMRDNFNRNFHNRNETGVDRIRRRIDDIDKVRHKYRVRLNPFTIISVGIILVMLFVLPIR